MPVFYQLESHYQIIGIAFLFLAGLGFFSLFPRDSSLSILKVMFNFFSSIERSMGIGARYLVSHLLNPFRAKTSRLSPLDLLTDNDKMDIIPFRFN